jgi:hypothetical protein
MYVLEDLTKCFNINLKKLMNIIGDVINSENIPNKKESVALYETAKRKINLVLSTDPVFMIDSAGAYLYKYREVITNGDFNDFILNTEKYITDEDKKDIEARSKERSGEEINCADALISSLRIKWSSFTEGEKKIIMKLVKRLLSEHCKYLIYIMKN